MSLSSGDDIACSQLSMSRTSSSSFQGSETPEMTPEGGKTRGRKKSTFLSEADKRKHHIQSEHRRRQAIRDAFLRLTELIPGLEAADARSEILVMSKSADYITALYQEHAQLLALLEKRGISVAQNLGVEFPSLDFDGA